MAQQEKYPELRAPKVNTTSQPPFILSANAVEFVPRQKKPDQQASYQQDGGQYQNQMPFYQSMQVHQRIAMAQGGVEQGGGDGSGGGGGGYEYTPMPHQFAATSNGPMMGDGGADVGKMSALQNRLSNMQIVDGGDNGKEFAHHHHQQQQHQHHHHHHHHNQQPMHHQHRGQHPGGGGHHGYHHHQQQQQHQPYVYEVGYQNNHHGQPGMGGDHRKYNNGGGQHQQQYQHHRSRQQHHHHHQQQHQPQRHQQQQHQQQQYGGGNQHHDYMDGGGSGGYNMVVPNWDSNFQADSDQVSYAQMEAMDYLTEVIAELLDNPGMFDEVQQNLPDKLGELRHDHYVLSSTIEMIFEQSIRESNFRYMGARLCQLLDSLNGPNLRHLLRLKMEDQNHELPQFMSHEQVKVRGATLFLAELYMQLRMPEQTFGKAISEHIISAIETLLSKRGPENTKCVCQCLKLCGYELEQDCRDKVEAILKKLQEPQAVQSSTEAMIRSVLELRKNSWGRSEEIATAPEGLSDNLLPVFYGPDGKMLTEEESSFLAATPVGKGPNAYSSYDDDDEFGMVDPDADPEVQEAYEQFLLHSNANAQAAQNRLQEPAVRGYRPDA